MTHIDLFTGIGGFSLACQWNGIQTEVMVEKDEKCRDFLRRTYPDIPIIPDIREFDGTKWQGRFILTGGVPCQPASRAGKQRGKEDDRWLWGEALRVLAEAKPCWALFENPPGIYDVGFDGILSDLESTGYELGICEIPACAVNSPQIRQRVWIVANAIGSRPDGQAVSVCGERPEEISMSSWASQSHMADTEGILPERTIPKRNCTEEPETPAGNRIGNFWQNSLWLPCADGKLRRTPDFIEQLVDGVSVNILEELAEEGWPHRSVLAALGNSIVPQVAFQIIQAIVRANDES